MALSGQDKGKRLYKRIEKRNFALTNISEFLFVLPYAGGTYFFYFKRSRQERKLRGFAPETPVSLFRYAVLVDTFLAKGRKSFTPRIIYHKYNKFN